MKCDSYMPSCDGEDFSDTGQWYVASWCLMVDWNKKYSLRFGDERVRIERRWRWNQVAAEWESLKQCRSTRCRFGTRALPCNPAGWTVRRSLHRLTGWIHANEPLLLNIGHTIIGLYHLYLHAYVYFSVFRQLGIKYKYLEFLAEGTPAMTTTSSTSLAIPMRQHVQSGETICKIIRLQNHHN